MHRIPTEEESMRTRRERGPRSRPPAFPPYDASYMAHQTAEYRRTPTFRPPPPSIAASNFYRSNPPDARPGRFMPPPSQPPLGPPPGPPERRNAPAYLNEHHLQTSRRPPRPMRPPHMDLPPVKQYEPANFRERIQEQPWYQAEATYHSDHARNASYSSRLTESSLGTIPDFPAHVDSPPSQSLPVFSNAAASENVPVKTPAPSRGRAQTLYTTASWISPIPEESSRLNTSPSSNIRASTAAHDSSWLEDEHEEGPETVEKGHYADRETDFFDGGDDSHLVRNASLGKMGKPSLVHTKSVSSGLPSYKQVHKTNMTEAAFQPPETGARSDESLVTDKALAPPTRDVTLIVGRENGEPFRPNEVGDTSTQTDFSRVKRPRNLDINAVRNAEARGSLTSLPDLIRRATRLETMLENGKRPGSRLGDISVFLSDKLSGSDIKTAHNRKQSGLSDLLATFPTPAETNCRSRATWFRGSSWPAVPKREELSSHPSGQGSDRRRKCCGIPVWRFVILLVVLLGIIAVAVTLPLEFLVFKKGGNHEQGNASQCPADFECRNGGVSELSSGGCVCLCTNGFTGADCSHASFSVCSTFAVTLNGSSDKQNVTIGKALPRLLSDANSNFSVPLSAADIVATLNAAGVSCMAQNALVTFEGFSTPDMEVDAVGEAGEAEHQARKTTESAEVVSVSVVTVTSTVVNIADREAHSDTVNTDHLEIDTSAVPSVMTVPSLPTTTASAGGANPTAVSDGTSFDITQQVLDFARIAVLYVLQEGDVNAASKAQSSLEKFFEASGPKGLISSGLKIVIGKDKSVDLINFTVDVGEGAVGRKKIGSRGNHHDALFGRRSRLQSFRQG